MKLMHHAWIAVLLTGFAASLGAYWWLAGQEHTSLRTEIAHRSDRKLQSVKDLLGQHVDASMAAAAFMDGEMLAHEYVEEAEVVGFLRDMLNQHPDDFTSMALVPAAEHGDTVFMAQSGRRLDQLDPPVDMARLARPPAGGPRLTLVDSARGKPRLRLLMATRSKPHGHAVVDLNSVYIIAGAITQGGLPAGLDIEVLALDQGREVTLLRHASRTRKAAEEEEEEQLWQDGFEVAGLGIVMRTRAAPALVAQFITLRPLASLIFSLAFSLLAAWFVFNRSRYGERLRLDVAIRTSELSAERKTLHNIMDYAPVGIWSLRKDGRMDFINKAFYQATGIDEQAYLHARHYKDVLDDETARQCMASDEAAMHQVDPVKSVEQVLFADGKRHAMEVLKIRVTDSDGVPEGLIGIGQDISERLAHEQVLKGEREKLASVIDHANECVFIMDEDGCIENTNPAASRLFGYTPEEWHGMSVHDLVPQEIRADHMRWHTEEMVGQHHSIMGKTRELGARRKDGSVFPVEVTVNEFESEGIRRLSVILRDLTARKQQEWSQETLLAMRAISQEQMPLGERLQRMMDSMFGDPWDFLHDHGAIFLAGEERLVLAASHGWSKEDRQRCTEVAFGECLCGKAIKTGEPIYCPHRLEKHKLAGLGRPDHGYLCAPLMQGDQRLGLINFTLRPGMDIPEPFHDFCRQTEDILVDMIARQQAVDALKDSEQKYRQLVESTPLGIIIHEQGIVHYANPAVAAMLGASSPQKLEGRNVLDHVTEKDRKRVRERMTRLASGNDPGAAEERLLRMDGAMFWAEVQGIPTIFNGRPAVQVLVQDISARKEAEEKLAWLSYYDELTGLPNRRLFADRARQALALAIRDKSSLALIYLDLDRFKFINDTLGHTSGDVVLKEAGTRLDKLLRESDTAARMGGDEFAVLLQDADVATAMRVAAKIREALRRPYQLGDQNLVLDVSIGIAIFPQDGKDTEALLQHADTAMYHAKRNQAHIHYFSAGMEDEAARRLMMEQELAKAADEKQLMLYYQGQHAIVPVSAPFPPHYQGKHLLAENVIISVESLVRWRHPELGLVSPAEFIPFAEETGLIRPITHWVLAEAGRQAAAWEEAGIRPGRISVNISAVQLMQKGLAEEIIERINETGAKPEWMEIEITETAAMREPETAIGIMRELTDAGVSIAIDDFGTGYSSLAYLKRLPAEWLKIDITFIRNLPDDEEDAAIVRSTIAMAHALGMKTIAEGVETKEQLEFLRGEGCDAVQGYLFSKPLPADEVSAHIKDYLNL